MAKLVLSSGGAVMQQLFIDKGRLTIGRDAHNDIPIDDPTVSREHSAILTVGNDQIVEDLHSSNGTIVNGTRVSRHILQHRDVIQYGAFSLCYLNPKAAAADLERTMLIAALPAGDTTLVDGGDLSTARAAKTRFPRGRIRVIASPRLQGTIELDRVVATFGRPGKELAVITRRPHGYFVTHVEGERVARVNRQPIGTAPRALRDRDVIEVADDQLEFLLD